MGKNFRMMLLVGVLLMGLWVNVLIGQAAELTVTASTARIRAEASTSSEIVGSTEQGKKITAEAKTTDSSGQTWYKVSLGGNNYGYILSSLVEISGDTSSLPVEGGGTVSSPATQPAATTATPIEERSATINKRSTNVRTGASTSHNPIISLPMDTVITVVGEATGSDGQIWYEMKATVDGEEINGFVREDMIDLGEPVAPPVEEGQSDDPAEGAGEMPAEGEGTPTEVPEVSGSGVATADMDYFTTYETDSETGQYIYYLNNRAADARALAEDLWNLPASAEAKEASNQKEISRGKTIIIILTVIIFILGLGITVLLFKIRDLYDDYDEEEEPAARKKMGFGGFRKSGEMTGRGGEPPVGRSRRPGEPASGPSRRPGDSTSGPARRPGEPTGGPARRSGEPSPGGNRRPGEPSSGAPRRPGEPAGGPSRRPGEPARAPREQEGQRVRRPGSSEMQAAERANRAGQERPAGKPAPRKPQNFLHDDDEFEFEFLNMDDKE